MSMRKINASIPDHVTAYHLAIESLPKPSSWLMALRQRRDGTNPEAVFAVIDWVRMQLHMRLSALRDTASNATLMNAGQAHLAHRTAPLDRHTAHMMVIRNLPRPSPMWSPIITNRADGSTPSGVYAVIDALRVELYGLLGNLETSAGSGVTSNPALSLRRKA